MITNTKVILEKVALHNGIFIEENNDSLKCICRYGHRFTIKSDDDWCPTCTTDAHKIAITKEVNAELTDLKSDFYMYDLNIYGVGKFICNEQHISTHDVDEIPDECSECIKNTHDVWGEDFNKIKADREIYNDEDIEFLGEDSENSNIYGNYNDDEEYDSEYFNEWDGADSDMEGSSQGSADYHYGETINSSTTSRIDENEDEYDVEEIFKKMRMKKKEMVSEKKSTYANMFSEYGDIDKMPPLIIPNKPVMFRYNNLTIDPDELNLKIYKKD